MKLRANLQLLAAGLIGLYLSGVAVPQAPSFKASIEGLVHDEETGRPIAGAQVYVFDGARVVPPPNEKPAVTDSSGYFSVEIRQPGAYRLLPDQPGFVYSRPKRLKGPRNGVTVRVSEAGQSPRVDLPMVRESSIVGQILDSRTGQPIPSLRMSVTFPGFDTFGNRFELFLSNPSMYTSVVQTNDRGEFRVYGLQAGDYFLMAMTSTFPGIPRYYPGVSNVAKATLIQVEKGRETRIASMLMESPLRAVQIRLRFTDPIVSTSTISAAILGTSTNFASGSGIRPQPIPRDMVLTLLRGSYDLLITARPEVGEAYYSREMFEAETQEMVREVKLTPGTRVSGSIKLQDSDGNTLNTEGVRCWLRSTSSVTSRQLTSSACPQSQVSPGHYWLEMLSMPADAYVVSAKSGDTDVLRDGLNVEAETQFSVVLASPGAIVRGVVRNGNGERISDATVALVPDAPYHNAGPLYRADITSYDGSFELRGVAPGRYQLFALSDIQGAGYRNADFMKLYEGKGRAITIENAALITLDLTALD